jgi:hypothetical protein
VLRSFATDGRNPFDHSDVQVSSIHWSQPCPDGSTRDVKYTHLFRPSQQCHAQDDMQVNAFVVDPTECQVQLLDGPSIAQFAVTAVANAESDPISD